MFAIFISRGVRRGRGRGREKKKSSGTGGGKDIVASVSARRRIIPNVICMTGLRKRLAETSGEDI